MRAAQNDKSSSPVSPTSYGSEFGGDLQSTPWSVGERAKGRPDHSLLQEKRQERFSQPPRSLSFGNENKNNSASDGRQVAGVEREFGAVRSLVERKSTWISLVKVYGRRSTDKYPCERKNSKHEKRRTKRYIWVSYLTSRKLTLESTRQ